MKMRRRVSAGGIIGGQNYPGHRPTPTPLANDAIRTRGMFLSALHPRRLGTAACPDDGPPQCWAMLAWLGIGFRRSRGLHHALAGTPWPARLGRHEGVPATDVGA
ncbi:MAG: hypothetical protein ACK54K_04975 [Gemmatimonadaceae bacterium]